MCKVGWLEEQGSRAAVIKCVWFDAVALFHLYFAPKWVMGSDPKLPLCHDG